MSTQPSVETIQSHGCRVALRRVEGPLAREIFFICEPPAELADAGPQAEAIYRAILDVLDDEGGSFESLVSETVFLRDLRANLEPVRAARRRVFEASEAQSHEPATTEIEQPPLNEKASLEVAVQAIVPNGTALRVDHFKARSDCTCVECVHSHGLRIHLGDEVRFYAGSLYGRGGDAYEQTLAMFGVADDLLKQAGMEFGDIVRTWIHLGEMERDYDGLNRARREFFAARGINPPPASTGIGGGPVPELHRLCLGVHAIKARSTPERTVMTAPTLNEAGQYGADFVRGMKVAEANKVALHVSGTASVDEAGRTAHPEDFEAQVDRMLVNVAALLEGQGASFDDIVSAVTYVKRPADAERLRGKFRNAGFEGFPNALVAATVCRPELLCETEVLAVLPKTDPTLLAPDEG